jgi:hypothetical protein
MKKLFLVVFVAILAIGSGFAQGGGQRDPAARLQRELDALTTELGLSKDQVEKITPIVTEGQKKQSDEFTKMREAGEVDRTKMNEVRAKFTAEMDKKLKAALPAEMGAKLDALRKKQAEERAARQQGQ